MKKKIFIIIAMLMLIIVGFNPDVNADAYTLPNAGGTTSSDASLDKIINSANNFFGNSILQKGTGFLDMSSLFDMFISMVFNIGNLVILCSAAVMGLRYVWSGVAEKASIKESAINMSVGVIFFYMARGIYEFSSAIVSGIIIGANNTVSVFSFSSISNNIWSNVAYVVKIFALLGFVATGLKYMMSAADTRADLKKRLLPVVAGLLVIFCMTDVISFIIKATSETLNISNNSVNNVSTPSSSNVNSNVKLAVESVWATAKVIVQVLAIATMAITGVRYMFSAADTRADLKKQTVILLAGAAMIFGAVEIISFIQKVGENMI